MFLISKRLKTEGVTETNVANSYAKDQSKKENICFVYVVLFCFVVTCQLSSFSYL